MKAQGWSTGESQAENYTRISLGGERGKQVSNQTRPQIARAWVSSGPESWLRCCPSLQAQLPGLRAACSLLTLASGFLLFTWDAFAPSSASRESTHLSGTSSDVTFSVKPSWVSSRQQRHPGSGFCRQAPSAVSGVPQLPSAQPGSTGPELLAAMTLLTRRGGLQQHPIQPCTQ